MDQHSLDVGFWRLRQWRLDDVETVLEAGHDELVPLVTTVPKAPSTTHDAKDYVRRQWSRSDQGGWSWALATAPDDVAIGSLTILPREHGRFSVGYWVLGAHRGRGAAGEALRAASEHVLQSPHVARLELYVEPWNAASVVTAERAGFEREGLLRSWQSVGGTRRDMYMYARLPQR